jgi:hypothetical protein
MNNENAIQVAKIKWVKVKNITCSISFHLCYSCYICIPNHKSCHTILEDNIVGMILYLKNHSNWVKLGTCTSIVGCWLLKALEMLQNPTTLLNEATSWRTIGIESIRLWEDKNYFCSFICGGTRGGAIFSNLKMIHKLIEKNYNKKWTLNSKNN